MLDDSVSVDFFSGLVNVFVYKLVVSTFGYDVSKFVYESFFNISFSFLYIYEVSCATVYRFFDNVYDSVFSFFVEVFNNFGVFFFTAVVSSANVVSFYFKFVVLSDFVSVFFDNF